MARRQKTRPDVRLPQSLAGGQGLYLRSFDHLGRSSEAKEKKTHKSKVGWTDGLTDRWMDRRTDEPTKEGVESRGRRQKRKKTFLHRVKV